MKVKMTLLAAVVLAAVACKSTVSLEDLQKQQEKTNSAIADMREETQKLVKMKEQFTIDEKARLISDYEDRIKNIQKEIKKLKGTNISSSDAAAGSVKDAVKSLEKKEKETTKLLNQAKQIQPENWGASSELIGKTITQIEQELAKVMEVK